MGVPILGICYGAQLMAYQMGGKVETAPVSEYGRTEVDIDSKDGLFQDVADKTICWMSHTDYILSLIHICYPCADFPAETTVFRIFYVVAENAVQGAGSMA